MDENPILKLYFKLTTIFWFLTSSIAAIVIFFSDADINNFIFKYSLDIYNLLESNKKPFSLDVVQNYEVYLKQITYFILLRNFINIILFVDFLFIFFVVIFVKKFPTSVLILNTEFLLMLTCFVFFFLIIYPVYSGFYIFSGKIDTGVERVYSGEAFYLFAYASLFMFVGGRYLVIASCLLKIVNSFGHKR